MSDAVAALPHARPELERLPLYRAGRPPAAVAGLTSHKLSSNENPFGPLPEVARAAAGALELNRYPDATAAPLRDALAETLDVRAEGIVTGTGSLDVLNTILAAYAGRREDGTADEVIFAWRSFESYPISVALAGASAVAVPLTADGGHDLDAFLAAITRRTRVVMLCTPNNPTGPALTGTAVREFLQRVPDDILVVIDEAYVEFVRGEDRLHALAIARERPNVIVLRTFSKAHGLADLRVGYGVGNPETMANVRRAAAPFTVSNIGQAAAIASLRALPRVLERVEAIVAERGRVVTALRADGWPVPDAQGNFFWLPLGAHVERFAHAALAEALSFRAFAGAGVRVSIGAAEANDRVLALCARWRRSAA
jgi:histidinol-phosphate aminotransferase